MNDVPPGGHVRGREILNAGQTYGPTTDHIRCGHRPEDRRGSRPHRPAVAPCPCRRGHGVMNRRELISLVVGATVAIPHLAGAQSSAMPTIGFLSTRASGDDPQLLAALRRGLNEAGF